MSRTSENSRGVSLEERDIHSSDHLHGRGFTDWANQKKILIIRKEDGKEKRITVNYKKIMKGNDPGSTSF